jgi:hypothetical protein
VNRPSLPRAARLLASAAAAALCIGCTAGRMGAEPAHITPRPLSGAPAAPAAGSSAEDRPGAGSQRPRISIDPAYTILQVITANLDQDSDEEQLIVVKRLSDIASPLHLVIADADPDRGTYYYQSWEADTNATDNRVFSVTTRDLAGDHGLQIVASGMNEAGQLTLDVFKALPPSPGKGLTYKPVCQLVADDIEIKDVDRPDSYTSSQKPGEACPIVATLRDSESPNVMDLVSITYSWSQAEGRYVPGAAEKKPGDQVQQEQLRSLFSVPGEEAFEQFISGSWIQIQAAPAGKGKEAPLGIISFDPVNRKVSISSGTTQEAYIWRESHRTLPNKLWIIGENETVLAIRLNRTFTITADALNAITVAVGGAETSDTTSTQYTKVTDEIRDTLIDKADGHVALSGLTLSGVYSAASGTRIDFQPPRITWSDAELSRSGTFILFSMGKRTILTARFPRGERLQDRILSWTVAYREKKDAKTTTRLITLSPVQLTMNGCEDAKGDELTLEQAQPSKK